MASHAPPTSSSNRVWVRELEMSYHAPGAQDTRATVATTCSELIESGSRNSACTFSW